MLGSGGRAVGIRGWWFGGWVAGGVGVRVFGGCMSGGSGEGEGLGGVGGWGNGWMGECGEGNNLVIHPIDEIRNFHFPA